jgi:hypothetical protein
VGNPRATPIGSTSEQAAEETAFTAVTVGSGRIGSSRAITSEASLW